ncbi:MAG: hypothetical protein ACI8PT_002855 [Gammaproteobacteria bacterium]|jgi:hypothetical protein
MSSSAAATLGGARQTADQRRFWYATGPDTGWLWSHSPASAGDDTPSITGGADENLKELTLTTTGRGCR